MDNKVYQREWYRQHATTINAKRREKVECPTCQQLFSRSSLLQHVRREGKFGVLWKNIFSFQEN